MTQQYVWYVSYGSNLLRERFDCYIKGGTPPGSTQEERGCREGHRTPPRDDREVSIPYQLYFAKEQSKWGKGGVAFIGHTEMTHSPTIGRMYLITKEQFEDVVAQENGVANLSIDLGQMICQKKVRLNGSWYGTVVYLGDTDGHPKCTFTANEDPCGTLNAPAKSYLKIIFRGLRQLNKTAQEAAYYLVKVPGANQQYTVETIQDLDSC